MASNCEVKNKILENWKSKGILDSSNRIIDKHNFNKLNQLFTEHAIDKYGLPGNTPLLFSTKRVTPTQFNKKGTIGNYERAIPNDKVLALLDTLIDEFKDNLSDNDTNNFALEGLRKLESLKKSDKVIEDVNVEEPVTNHNLLFGSEEVNEASLEQVLSNIDTNVDTFNSNALKLLEPIKELTSDSLKVKVVENETLSNPNNIMEFNLAKNTILIPNATLEYADANKILTSLVHEMIHSVTADSLENPNTVDKKIFYQEIKEAYDRYSDLAREQDLSDYGFTNIHEFVAELASNEEFQNTIKGLENKSLWSKIVNAIRSLLGFRPKDNFTKILDSIYDLAKLNDPSGEVENLILAKEADEGKSYYDISSRAQDLKEQSDKILDRLEHQLRDLKRMTKRSKDPSNLEGYEKRVNNIIEDIKKLDDSKQWEGIQKYIDYVDSQLISLMNASRNVGKNKSDFRIVASRYKTYLKAYENIVDLNNFISESIFTYDDEIGIPLESLKLLQNQSEKLTNMYNSLNQKMSNWTKEVMFDLVNTEKHQTRAIKDWKDQFIKEWKDNNPFKASSAKSRNKWHNRAESAATAHLESNPELLADIVRKGALDFVNTMDIEISATVLNIVSGENTNSRTIQTLINIIEQHADDMNEAIRKSQWEIGEVFEEYIKGATSRVPSKMYKNILEQSSYGEWYFKGEYSVKFMDTYRDLKHKENLEVEKLIKKYGENTKEVKDYLKNSEFSKWYKENTKSNGQGGTVPIAKWVNSKLNARDQKLLDFARNVLNRAKEETYGINPLVQSFKGHTYYRLPTMYKSKLERLVEGEISEYGKDMLRNLDIRVGDLGYESNESNPNVSKVKLDINNNPVEEVKVNFRGKLKNPGEQSLDVFTLLSLEMRNGKSFKYKTLMKHDAEIVRDFAKDKNFVIKKGGNVILNAFNKRSNKVYKKGEGLNVNKRIQGIIESRVFDVWHKASPTYGNINIDKLIGNVMGYSAQLAMGMNEVSATTNVLNGMTQLYFEGIAGNSTTAKSIRKAYGKYRSDLPNIFKDVATPHKASFTNQFREMFNLEGTRSTDVKQAFIRDNFVKAFFNTGSMMFMESSGEHMIETVIGYSLVEDIKVMDKNHKFIDKEGNVVDSRDKAASLLDMLEMNDEGYLETSDKFTYTTHSEQVKYNDGGKELVNRFIRKKLYDTIGNYTKVDQMEANKHSLYQMVIMFRKYLVPMFISRYRGIRHFRRDVADLKPYERSWSDALQQYEIGSYTAVVRNMYRGIQAGLKNKSAEAMRLEWDKMSNYERNQFNKGVVQIITSHVILPALVKGTFMLFADDNDEMNNLGWATILQARRLQTELQSFTNIAEQWRTLHSPIIAMSTIEDAGKLLINVFEPWNWNEQYDSGPYKNQYKRIREVKKLIPVVKRLDNNYERMFHFINSQGGFSKE